MNFSHSSALRRALAAAVAAVLAGCGSDDGSGAFDEGCRAYELRDFKRADKLIQEGLAAAPADVDRQLMLARVKLALGELPEAKALVDKAAAVAGGDVDVRLLGAQIAWHLKDYDAARAGFAGVADDAGLDAETRAQGLAGLGIVEMTEDRPHFARLAFLRAIRLDRRNAAAWYHLGLIYRDGFGYFDAALEQFEIFVRLEASASPRVQKVQRRTIPDLKDQIARTAAARPGASKRDSAASAAAIVKAEAATKKGAHKTACAAYQQALAADPLSYKAAIGLANAWLKADATKAGQTKALENFKLACSLRPSAISTFLTAGSLASRLGFHAQAVEIYSRAVAASPTSIDALDGLVRALRSVGRKTKVAQAYQDYRDSLSARTRH